MNSKKDDYNFGKKMQYEDIKGRMKKKAKEITDNLDDYSIPDLYDLCVLNKMEEIYNPNKEEK